MFWTKKTESIEARLTRLIDAYLSGAMPLIATKLASNASTRLAVQIFILGMTDMLRQAEKCSWDEYISICTSIFKNHNLTPSNGVVELIQRVGQKIDSHEELARIMKFGAQSQTTGWH